MVTESKKMNCPMVSIIILTHNSFRYLLESIESILKQTYSNIQLIISDDSSISFPAEALINRLTNQRTESLKQIVLHETDYPKGKIQQLIDVFHRYCNGEYVLFMEAGDVFYSKTALEKLVRIFQKDDVNIEAILSQANLYDEWMRHFKREAMPQEAVQLICDNIAKNLVCYSSVLLRIPLAAVIYRGDWLKQNIDSLRPCKECASLAFWLALIRQGAHIRYSDFIGIKHLDEESRKMLTQAEYKYYLCTRKEQITCLQEFLTLENRGMDEEFLRIKQQYDKDISKENVALNKIKRSKRHTVIRKEQCINYLKKHKDTLHQYSQKKYLVYAISCFIYFCVINLAAFMLPLFYIRVLLGVSLLLVFLITMGMIGLNFAFKYRKWRLKMKDERK